MISYKNFRCGLSFTGTRQALAVEQREARKNGLYMYVTRRTVLGRMHQLKLSAYANYLREIEKNERQAKKTTRAKARRQTHRKVSSRRASKPLRKKSGMAKNERRRLGVQRSRTEAVALDTSGVGLRVESNAEIRRGLEKSGTGSRFPIGEN